ncbi:MAG: sugar phosphate nucleotidyltransferase [Bacteroidia bacterium]|nr:sugar phosphate nucleotidyltransferase [Bacteroidia bacterium]
MDSLKEAIVLAGGLGTRLRAAVPAYPKVLAPVAGRPFLAYLLQYLTREGVQRVILALGHRSEEVLLWLASQSWDIEIVPIVESAPLGTGGGLVYAWKSSRAHNNLEGKREGMPTSAAVSATTIAFLNGDTFFPVSLQPFLSFHRRIGTPITVGLAHVSPADRYGVVEVEGDKVKAFREKEYRPSGWIYGGIALVEIDWWESQTWPERFSWEEFLMQNVPPLSVGAFLAEGVPFIDIGVPSDYERAQTLVPKYAVF